MYQHIITVGLICILSIPGMAAPTGKELLDKMDKNFSFKTLISTATMSIKSRRGVRTVTSKSWSTKDKKSFTEYLSPAREKGTKMLKLDNALWMYTPMADRTIKIAGHLLRQSVMGSDLSYEDFMEVDKLSDTYTATVIGTESHQDRNCYVLELLANKEGLAYPKRKIWVDTERYLGLKEERYAKSGTLLKTTQILAVQHIQSRWYPKRLLFKDVLKTGEGTELTLESVKFDVPIPKNQFNKSKLRR